MYARVSQNNYRFDVLVETTTGTKFIKKNDFVPVVVGVLNRHCAFHFTYMVLNAIIRLPLVNFVFQFTV